MESTRKRLRLSETSENDSESGESYYAERIQFAAKRTRSEYSTASSFSGTGDDEPDLDTTDDGEANADAENETNETNSITSSQSSGFFSMQDNADHQMSIGEKLLGKMGHVKGKGLGKHQQGIVAPVEAYKLKGRRGLGHQTMVDVTASKFDPSSEEVSVPEEVSWLYNRYRDSLTMEQLKSWKRLGPKKETIDDETNFCDEVVLGQVLDSKSTFDTIGGEEMRKARTRCNPFELIRGVFFLNRAAMKMANMDKVFDFMFTKPKDLNDEDMVGPKELLYFADVCAGPGGFSEYVLYRKKWKAKGFGFTLKGDHDFRLSDFYAAPCETFEPHYGAKEDGNIFNPENITSFRDHVLKNTEGKGVHFMMADGGFSVEGKENIQEIVSKQLYLCQCLVALYIVRTNGHFVVKLFDLFTPFSVGLIYLMLRSFHQISIHKPNTSRPANSERYLICKYKREDCCDIANYFFSVNQFLWAMGEIGEEDVTQLVPLEVLKSDEEFYEYITLSNNSIGRRQLASLRKIAAFCEDPELVESRQQDIRKECLAYWEIPDQARTAPPKSNPRSKVEELLKGSSIDDLFSKKGEELVDVDSLAKQVHSIYDWHCVVLGSEKGSSVCTFYLGLGRQNVYRLERSGWKMVSDMQIELTPNTLVYGEVVPEFVGGGRSQIKNFSFHLIDGLFLGGEDIRKLHITERREICSLFVKSLRKTNNPLRMKELMDLEDIDKIFSSLELRKEKNGRPCIGLPLDSEYFFKPSGVIFFKGTKAPWKRHRSSSTGHKYYFNANTRQSEYDTNRPSEAIADFSTCFKERLVWWWDNGVKVHEWQQQEDTSKLQGVDVHKFVSQRNRKP